jgi:hypothetical protein
MRMSCVRYCSRDLVSDSFKFLTFDNLFQLVIFYEDSKSTVASHYHWISQNFGIFSSFQRIPFAYTCCNDIRFSFAFWLWIAHLHFLLILLFSSIWLIFPWYSFYMTKFRKKECKSTELLTLLHWWRTLFQWVIHFSESMSSIEGNDLSLKKISFRWEWTYF